MLASRYTWGMTRKKMTTYVDEDLLRSAKIVAAQRDGKIYEVFEEALKRYLENPYSMETHSEEAEGTEVSLAEALSERSRSPRRAPGVPRERALRLSEGETLSEAVLAERGERGY